MSYSTLCPFIINFNCPSFSCALLISRESRECLKLKNALKMNSHCACLCGSPGYISVKNVGPRAGARWSAPGRQCCCWYAHLWGSSTQLSAPWGTQCRDPVREPTTASPGTTEVQKRKSNTSKSKWTANHKNAGYPKHWEMCDFL